MELLNLDFLSYMVCLACATVFVFGILRRCYFHVLDPWIVIPINQALIVAYSLYAYWNGGLQVAHLTYIVLALLAFAIGVQSLYGTRQRAAVTYICFGPALVSALIIALATYQICFDVIFIASRGVPAFSVTGATPHIYGGGFGVVKYIHDANGLVLSVLAFKALLVYRKPLIFAIAIGTLIYPMVFMEAGKAGLINLVFTYVAAVYFLRCQASLSLSIAHGNLILACAAVALFLVYKFTAVAETGYEATALLAFVRRVINSADGIYMYFVQGAYAAFDGNLSITSFLLAHITPYFGYVDEIAHKVGVLLPLYAFGFGEEGYGPSPPFQVVGHMAFGAYGVLYAFAIGLILSVIKFRPLLKRNFVLYLICYLTAPTLAGDASLFLYYLSILLVLLPPVAIAYVVAAAGSSGSVTTVWKIP